MKILILIIALGLFSNVFAGDLVQKESFLESGLAVCSGLDLPFCEGSIQSAKNEAVQKASANCTDIENIVRTSVWERTEIISHWPESRTVILTSNFICAMDLSF